MKKFDVEISEEAERNLNSIRDYIALDSPERALDFREKLVEKCMTLASFPKRCPVIPEEISDGLEYRHLIFGDYRVVYCIQNDRVEIVLIKHGSIPLKLQA